MGSAQSLIPQLLPLGINVDTETTENGGVHATLNLGIEPDETTGDAMNRVGGMVAMGMSMISSLDPAMVAGVINGPMKSLVDHCLVQAALVNPSPDDLESKHGPAITAVNAYTELILDCWDKSARTEEEIADLLAQLENRKGSVGERIYAKVSGADSLKDSNSDAVTSDEATD